MSAGGEATAAGEGSDNALVTVAAELRLSNFKAFEKFAVTFGDHVLLVGPNNAGKSTLLAAVRVCAQMLRVAMARSADRAQDDRGRQFLVYGLSGERLGLVEENLKHEFRVGETRLQLTFSNKARVVAVWPGSDEEDAEDGEPFFYVDASGVQPRRPAEVRATFPPVGVVPMLSPVERVEPILTKKYLRENAESRIVNRHFRNHLELLRGEESESHESQYEEFVAFVEPWIPELEIDELRRRTGGEGQELDLFYREPGRRAPKEIFWAGDGIQVWLQILLHVFRLRDVSVMILDEPDLYLHADLQRRLVQLLETLDAQTITATHSPEMLAEARAESVVWVDKSRARGIRAPSGPGLSDLSVAIGSQFNVRLAKALRATTVLFVEGKDMRILRTLARKVGADKLAREQSCAIVSLEGFSNWTRIEPFKWLLDEFLERTVETFVILDRDYRSPGAVTDVTKSLRRLGVRAHVWERKELESYLLHPEAIARVSGATTREVANLMKREAEALKNEVLAAALDEELRARVTASSHRVTVTRAFMRDFEAQWADESRRLEIVPAKELLSGLNRRLAKAAYKTISARSVAAALGKVEIADEVRDLLIEIEASI